MDTNNPAPAGDIVDQARIIAEVTGIAAAGIDEPFLHAETTSCATIGCPDGEIRLLDHLAAIVAEGHFGDRTDVASAQVTVVALDEPDSIGVVAELCDPFSDQAARAVSDWAATQHRSGGPDDLAAAVLCSIDLDRDYMSVHGLADIVVAAALRAAAALRPGVLTLAPITAATTAGNAHLEVVFERLGFVALPRTLDGMLWVGRIGLLDVELLRALTR